MKKFLDGFTGFFSMASLGAAVALVLFLAVLIWAGFGPDKLAAQAPIAPWNK